MYKNFDDYFKGLYIAKEASYTRNVPGEIYSIGGGFDIISPYKLENLKPLSSDISGFQLSFSLGIGAPFEMHTRIGKVFTFGKSDMMKSFINDQK